MTLTETGRRRLGAAAPGHVAAVRATVMDALTPEQVRALGVIGRRDHRALDPDAAC